MKQLFLLILLCCLMFWSGCSESGKRSPATPEGTAHSTQTATPASNGPPQQPTTVAQAETSSKPATNHSEKLPRAASPLTWIGLAGALCLGGGIYLKLFLKWLR
jgi:hypothetical protein